MKKIKENKGITLIALIITIIVMLILVGVTVSVSLNGGLFTKTRIAAEGTQIEMDREMLIAAVIGAMKNDATVDFSELDNNLPNGFTGSDGIYTSKKGNTFKVSLNGTIENIEPEVEKIVREEDEEYAYWKTDGNGTILYWDYPEDKEVPEILVVPCQIGNEKITKIGLCALSGVRFQRNEDGTMVMETDDSGDEYPVILDAVDENNYPTPTNLITRVKKIVVSKGIMEIGEGGLCYVEKCINIVLPTTLTKIKSSAFSYCKALPYIKIPDGVIDIGSYAFDNCKLLNNIEIPSTVENMGAHVFDYCENLQKIYINGKSEIPPDSDNEPYSDIGWSAEWKRECDADVEFIK